MFDKWDAGNPGDKVDITSDCTITAIWKNKPVTKTLSSIAITTPPTKTTYTAGQSFNKAGMVVTATYSDSSTAEVTGYTVSPSGALTTSNTSVTISYTEGGVTKTATQAIAVNSSGGSGGGGGITTQYTLTYKGVCEGRELPAYEAASEFISRTAGELDKLLASVGGDKGALNTLDKLPKAKNEAEVELAGLLERLHQSKGHNETLEKSAVAAANKAESLNRQVEAVGKLIDVATSRNRDAVAAIVAGAVKAAAEILYEAGAADVFPVALARTYPLSSAHPDR